MVLKWLFTTIHGVAWVWNSLSERTDEQRQRLTNAVMGVSLLYETRLRINVYEMAEENEFRKLGISASAGIDKQNFGDDEVY